MHVRLKTDLAEVDISPSLGASVLSYRLADGTNIFRPTQMGETDPFRTACFPMIPWCNRIAGGIEDLDGEVYEIAPTHPDHPLPIHGSAARQAWKVKSGRSDEISLALCSDQPAPFRYDAEITYHLSGAALSARLSITNTADYSLPYGVGLHPWFPRTGMVGLSAPATHYQAIDEDMLPTGDVPVTDKPEWDFSDTALLPEGLIDTGFNGWDGRAVIGRDDGWGLEIRTDPVLECYQVYSPGADADFFCFEPVSHPIDAHNTEGHPGLWPLKSGETAKVTFTFTPAC